MKNTKRTNRSWTRLSNQWFHERCGIRRCQVIAGYLFVATSVACAGTLLGQGQTDNIVITNKPAPDDNGVFNTFENPLLNNQGQVAFSSFLTGTGGGTSDNSGLFRFSGGIVDQIARKRQLVPNGNGAYDSFGSLSFNDSGQIAFSSQLTGTSGGASDNSGIFRSSNGGMTQIARRGQSVPGGNGSYANFNSVQVNNAGQVMFLANLSETSGGLLDNQGIFRGEGGTITQIARRGQAAPDGNGLFSSLPGFSANNSGQLVFQANLIGTSGGSSDNSGIFRHSGGVLAHIVRRGQTVPGGNGTYSSLSSVPQINESGQSVFFATLADTSGGTSDNSGLFRSNSSGTISQIARKGQLAPDGNGVYSVFNTVSLNDSGQVAFRGSLAGTSGGTTDNQGLFRGSGGAITQIARRGQTAPDGNGVYSNLFENSRLNNSGQIVFASVLTGTSDGANDNLGLFTSDGIDTLQVLRKGDVYAGSTVTSLFFNSISALNEMGQIAYRATLANGQQVINRWTPDLHWRGTTSSTWEAAGRWTLSLNPDFVHDVYIDPVASLTVTGPATDRTVRSLQIGGGSGLARLNLRSGAILTATNGVTIASTGTLSGDGTIAANVTNNGTILANNVSVTGTLTNNHLIHGNGRVTGNIVNTSSGEIRANQGDVLRLSGSSFSNSGLVEIHGGELRVGSTFQNNPSTSLVSLRNGSLIAEAGIGNQGSIAATQGFSTIRGAIDNTGIIQISGGAHATFFGDVTQNGTLQVAAVGNSSSTAVFLGDFSGSGGFVGGGDVYALGDLRPGNSPASVLYDGNLFLGASTNTFIELGGLDIGQFDQMVVTGDLSLAGKLFVSLIDDHSLGFNQHYLIGDIGGSLFGQFSGLGEGALVGNFGGFDLFITYAAGGSDHGIALFTAIPEPGAGLLVLTALVGLVLQRRRLHQTSD